jgi:hypothetical protein
LAKKKEDVKQEPVQEEAKAPQTPLEEFVEYQRRALEETGKAIESLLPPKFVEHAKEAQKESLAGFKLLADTFIAEMEKVAKKTEEATGSDDDKPSTTGNTKVKVQVD